MKMSMGFSHRQVHECNICGGYNDDHESSCPRYLMKQVREIMVRSSFRCPNCREGTTLVNAADFIECQGCRDQFTTGAIYDDGKIVLLGDTVARMLPEKGNGNFPLLKRMRELAAAEKEALKKKKKEVG